MTVSLRLLILLLLLWPLSGRPAPADAGNPALHDAAAYLAYRGLSRFTTGSTRPDWVVLGDRRLGRPVVTPQVTLISGGHALYALDPITGRSLWHQVMSARVFAPSVDRDKVYVGSEDGGLWALRRGDGRILWQRRFNGWVYSPAVAGDVLVCGGQAHRLYGLNAADGSLRWTLELDQELVHRPVAVDHRHVVVTTFSGRVLAVRVQDGGVHWQVQDAVPSVSPTTHQGQLFLRGFDNRLRVRDADDGRLLWQRRFPGPLRRPLRVTRRGVLLVDGAGRVHRLDAAGNTLEQYVLPSGSIGVPWLWGDAVRAIVGADGRRPVGPVVLPPLEGVPSEEKKP